MKIHLAFLFLFTFCTTECYAQTTSNESETQNSNGKAPSSKPATKAKYPNQRPVTVRQVEKQTGGKVIGAKTINVQGQQLNQIKVQMPNGRIIIHEQLFDSNGRSVETVDEDEPV